MTNGTIRVVGSASVYNDARSLLSRQSPCHDTDDNCGAVDPALRWGAAATDCNALLVHVASLEAVFENDDSCPMRVTVLEAAVHTSLAQWRSGDFAPGLRT